MSITRHHADWLSLIEVSGPFISLPVLMRIFPQGLEPRDTAQAKVLRAAYEEWQDNPTAPGRQRAWVIYVLTAVLGYPEKQITEGQALHAGLEVNMLEIGESLRPDFALLGPAGSDIAGQPQLLIASYPAEQGLDKPVIGKHWKAAPTTRMMELLHGANVPLGLVTNGEQWMLVYAPRGETTGYVSWYATLWLDEPLTLRAFHSLLGARRFFGVAADNTLLALLKDSASDQQDVTDQLGYQVREAVEMLVQYFDAINQESLGSALKGLEPATIYDAVLTIMMRLVFLFSAEERGLLHLGKPLYDDNYAVSTLQEQLQDVADRYGEEVLERRYDAWSRLLATFRAVHGGIHHQDLLLQSYGGSLFDPDRYPFLEGRARSSEWRKIPAEPLAVNNRVVLHLLNSLQRLRTKTGGGAETRRVSFRALGVEQIGHVYEGLLDHTAICANELVLGIRGTRSKEPEVALSLLENLLAQGEDKVLTYLKEETGRSLGALRKELNNSCIVDEHKMLLACRNDEAMLARLRPFAGLIRNDSFERPWVVLPGSIFVTEGTTRRSTGTHYTPPSLTEPIVQNTLEPLVYVGPAEGLPKEHWRLKSPKEILELKVCDMAMGSGAFLVQACRYIAERLVEAWENEEAIHPGQVLITPDGKFSEASPNERLVPADVAERIAIARRVVADRCLYGVDINPMAVEMAKLSMWLVTVDSTRPFTFLDHAFKCGDSLLGITSLKQLENFSLRAGANRLQGFNAPGFAQHIEEAKTKREMLEAMPSDTPEQIAAKAALYAEAEEAVAKLNAAADVLISVELKGLSDRPYESEREASTDIMMTQWARGLDSLQAFAGQRLANRKCFHWALTFPELMANGGFDAIIGNPPFLWGMRISTLLGEEYLGFLQRQAGVSLGTADLCSHFVRRAFALVKQHRLVGLIVVDTISQGDTWEAGLKLLVADGAMIYRAHSSQLWPGSAGVKFSQIHLMKGKWEGSCLLDENKVEYISSTLRGERESIPPKALKENATRSYVGHYLMGQGFVLKQEDAEELLRNEPNAKEVVFPYLRGEDINQQPTQQGSNLVINFGNRSLEECEEKYPLALERIRLLVKPQRDNEKRKANRERWWQYAETRPALSRLLLERSVVIAQPFTTKYLSPTLVSAKQVFASPLVIVDFSDYGHLALIQSSIHDSWVRRYASTMGDRIRYSSSDCLETFPFPSVQAGLVEQGEKFYGLQRSIMKTRSMGFTTLQNIFNDPSEKDPVIAELRLQYAEIDKLACEAYGWQDLELGHGFYDTKQGIRFTISEVARGKVLDRLLALNHQRHAEEIADALTEAPASPTKRGRKKPESTGQGVLDL